MPLAKNMIQVDPLMMKEIRKAIKANAREDLRQIRLGEHSPNRFFVFNTKKKQIEKSQRRSQTRKSDDIYAASAVGALVIDSKTGADAVLPINDDTLELIELKLCYRDLQDCWVSSEILSDEKVLSGTNMDYTVYVGENRGKGKNSLKGSITASFEISEDGNLSSKNRRTFLCVRDDANSSVIDILELDGSHVLDFLLKRCKVRENKRAFKPKITYNQFLELGKRFHGVIPSVGMDEWCKDLVAKAEKKYLRRRAQLIKKLPASLQKRRLKQDAINRRRLELRA